VLYYKIDDNKIVDKQEINTNKKGK